MLTKNFYQALNTALLNKTAIVTTSAGAVETFNRGAVITSNQWNLFNAMTYRSTNSPESFPGVFFGTDATPATASDYDLGSIIPSSNMSVIVPTEVSFNVTNEYQEYTATYGVHNKTEEAISITEIGLFTGFGSDGSLYRCLVDRTVLDAPVTIPAGQSKQITYTIRFNYGGAV